MKKVAKWIAILWSAFCLIGVFIGIINVMVRVGNEYEPADAAIGLGLGMLMWVGIWLAVAGPALLIWLILEKKEPKQTEIKSEKSQSL